MMVSKDFKRTALAGLKGKWPLAIGAGFVAALLGGGITGSAQLTLTKNMEQSMDVALEQFLADPNIRLLITGIFGSIAFAALVYSIVCFIIGGAVSLGYSKFNLNLINGNNADIKDIVSEFGRFKEAFAMRFLRAVYTFLWSLLLIVPGIIASFSYSMAPYILMENPGMSGSEALKASKQLMDGNKWRLFCLGVSFIGWEILNGFTMGLGQLVLRPYREAAYAAFYREIKWEKYKRDFDAQNASDTANV